jgi:hypothetical protein
MVVVLCLDDGKRDIGFIEKNIVGPPRLGTLSGIAPDKHPSVGYIHLLPDLEMIPAGAGYCGRDEFSADVAFTECFFIRGFRIT